MGAIAYRVWREEDGQDLIEYSLLMVFIIIVAAVIMQNAGSAVGPVWQNGNATVQNAATAVS